MTLFQVSTEIEVSRDELLFPEARQRRESAQASRSMVRVQEPLASSGGHCNIEHEYTSVMVLWCYCVIAGVGADLAAPVGLRRCSPQPALSSRAPAAGVTALRASTPRHWG